MPAALVNRDDISAEELRRAARLEVNGRVACRLLAIANSLDGMSREGAAEQAGIDRQSLRDWVVVRFYAEGVPRLLDRPRSGRPSFLNEGELAMFRAMMLRGPNVEREGVSNWTAKDRCRLVEARFAVRYQESGRDYANEGDIAWHDGSSLSSLTRWWTSFWPAGIRRRFSARTACSTS